MTTTTPDRPEGTDPPVDHDAGTTAEALERAILGDDAVFNALEVADETGASIDQARRLWRALGFPNLVRARKARWGKHRARMRLEKAQRFSPFADPRDLPSDRCPRDGRSEESCERPYAPAALGALGPGRRT